METCVLDLRLRNFEGQILSNISTRLQFLRGQKPVGEPMDRQFTAGRERLEIPVFPLGAVDCTVSVERYEARNVGLFLPKSGQLVEKEVYLPRNAEADWKVRFIPWDGLTGRFAPLCKLLRSSTRVTLTQGRGDSKYLGSFTGEAYDDVDDKVLIEGKAGLLNMYAKLVATTVPTVRGTPWFSNIQQLLGIQRDRIVGVVHPRMAQLILRIRENTGCFPGYQVAATGRHYKNNIEPLLPLLKQSNGKDCKWSKGKIYSIKTRERIGVLQLVIAELTENRNGQTVYLLDTDVDENGRFLLHLGDFIKHKFNGGTHPIHVHDILHRTLTAPRIAYELT